MNAETEKIITTKLTEIEHLLKRIESNGRSRQEKVWYKPRSEIDGRQVQVNLRCSIIRIIDIDNVAQQFDVEFYLEAAWREPALQGKQQEEVEWDDEWDPRITFINYVSLDSCTTSHDIKYHGEDPVPEVRLGLRVVGTFKENLEVNDFPFHYQDLTIQVMSDWPDSAVKLCRDMTEKDSINTDTFTAHQTWDLQPLVLSRVPEQKEQEAGSVRTYPKYNFNAVVVRKSAYYIWNIAFIMLLILLLTFASLAVDPMDPGERMGVTLTLLLTSVAFKYVVTQYLPTGKYVLFCMVFQALFIVQNACTAFFPEQETAKTYDKVCGAVLGAVLFIFHTGYIFVVVKKRRRRDRMLKDMKKEFFDLCKEITNKQATVNQVTPRDSSSCKTPLLSTVP